MMDKHKTGWMVLRVVIGFMLCRVLCLPCSADLDTIGLVLKPLLV